MSLESGVKGAADQRAKVEYSKSVDSKRLNFRGSRDWKIESIEGAREEEKRGK